MVSFSLFLLLLLLLLVFFFVGVCVYVLSRCRFCCCFTWFLNHRFFLGIFVLFCFVFFRGGGGVEAGSVSNI